MPKPRRRKKFVSAIERRGNRVTIRPSAPLFVDRSGRPVSVQEARKMYERAKNRDRAKKMLKQDPVFSRMEVALATGKVITSEIPGYLKAVEKFVNRKLNEKEYLAWAKKLGVKLK